MKLFLFSTLTILGFSVMSQNLLDDFNVLSVPRESVPIGADWINGVGPNGEGISDNLIRKYNSLSAIQIESGFKEKLDLSIYNYIGLKADFSKASSIEYQNLAIFTVKDIYNLNLETGKSILYESIKADSIKIKITSSLDSEQKIRIIKKLNLSNDFDFNKTINISGKNLYLAYRVISLGKMKTKMYKPKITKFNGYTGISTSKFDKIELMIDVNPIYSCIDSNMQPGRVIRSGYNDDNPCLKTSYINLEIKDFNKVNINDGVSSTKTTKAYYRKPLEIQYISRVNSTIKLYYIEFTWLADEFYYFSEKASSIQVKGIKVPVINLDNPNALGW